MIKKLLSDWISQKCNWLARIKKFRPAFAILLFYFSSGLVANPINLVNRFDMDGDVLFRAYFIQRDLKLPSPPTESGDQKEEQSYSDYYLCQQYPAECRQRSATNRKEEQDFYTMRYRMNLAFRPSAFADVLYSMEVGHMTFGRESGKSGPGTGGRGSGRVNIETRQLLLRLHNQTRTVQGDLGIFSFGTPAGIVVATSGGGGRLQWNITGWKSSFEMVYVRSVDQSKVDGDSNGFTDTNFADTHLVTTSWKWNVLRDLRSHLYGVYQADNDRAMDDPQESNQETSRIFWGGLQLQWEWGDLEFLLHGIGNWGRFERPLANDPEILAITSNAQDPMQSYFTEAVKAPIRKKYKVNAGAGQFEIKYFISDDWNFTVLGAGASGRMPGDQEPDGTSIDYRSDQFRTTGNSFSYTEIALDDSGGYSIFAGGKLTGVVAKGARLEWRIRPDLVVDVAYFKLEAFRTPELSNNIYYQLYLDTLQADNDLGEEWNMHAHWNLFSDCKLSLNLAAFNAGGAYKALEDIEYGDSIYEASIYLSQKF